MFPKTLLTPWPLLTQTPAVPLEISLTWKPPTQAPAALTTAFKGEPGWADMGALSSALRRAGVLDNQAIALPGTTVMMPFGMRILERYVDLVHRLYRQCGLEEWDYPFLTPTKNFDPVRRFLNLDNLLLHVGTDKDFQKQTPRATLGPTGEEVIYPHWRHFIRKSSNLPVQMYRRSRYFRPASSGKRSGRSIMRGMEAADVFEFHCAYATPTEADTALHRYFDLFQRITQSLYVPVLWSTRPPWTNKEAVSLWAIGGDTPLPTGSTVQIASIYNQGQIFSKAYDIGFKQDGTFHHTYHVTGAITRRIFFAHLLLGMHASGDLLIHPDLAPDQVVIVFLVGVENDEPNVETLVQTLREHGIRTRLIRAPKVQIANRERRMNRNRGVPVEVYIQARRWQGDAFKVVLTRADTHEEAVSFSKDLRTLLSFVQPLLHNLGVAYEQRVQNFFEHHCREVASADALQETLLARYVAVCPLAAHKEVVLQIGRWHLGEVLGFTQSPESRLCVITGSPVDTVAFVSPRL